MVNIHFKDSDYLTAASDDQGNVILEKIHPIYSRSLPTRILSESMTVFSRWAMVRTVHSENLSRIVS